MLIIKTPKKGDKSTFDYLVKAEHSHTKEMSAADRTNFKKVKEFADRHNLNPKDPQTYEKYLNVKSNHEPAKVIGKLSESLNLEYSEELFKDVLEGKLDHKKYKLKSKLNVSNLQRDGISIQRKPEEGQERRQICMDIVAAAPKGLSIYYAVADAKKQELIRKAMANANEKIVDYMQSKMQPRSVEIYKKRENLRLVECEAMFFTHNHYENRGTIRHNNEDELLKTHGTPASDLDDDEFIKLHNSLEPHLHTHITCPNVQLFKFEKLDSFGNPILDPVTKKPIIISKFLSPDSQQILDLQLEISAMYDSILKSELAKVDIVTELNVLETGKESFTVAGISRDDELMFSLRRDDIIKYVENNFKKKGLTVASLDLAANVIFEAASKEIRQFKGSYNAKQIHAIIARNVVKLFGKSKLKQIREIQKMQKNQYSKFDFEGILKHQKLTTDGYIDDKALKLLIIEKLRFSEYNNSEKSKGLTAEIIEKQYQEVKSKMIREGMLLKTSKGNYTAKGVVLSQTNSIDLLKEFRKLNETTPINDKDVVANKKFLDEFNKANHKETNYYLMEGQYKACELVAQERHITFIEGWAGVGKTSSVIKYAKRLYTHKYPNSRVLGLAVQTSTSSALKEAGFDKNDCLSMAALAKKAFDKNGNIKPSFAKDYQNSLIVVDEASMLGSEDGEILLKFAKETNSKVVLVGDRNQIKSVTHGNFIESAFSEIQPTGAYIELSTVTRQKNDDHKELAALVRKGETDLAVTAMEKLGILNLTKTYSAITEEEKKAEAEKIKSMSSEELVAYKEQLMEIRAKAAITVKEKLVNAYYHTEGESKLIVVSTNDEIKEINTTIKQMMLNDPNCKKIDKTKQYIIKTSRKMGNFTKKSDEVFHAGDDIVFTNNVKDGKTKILNGDFAKILDSETNKKGETILTLEIYEEGIAKQVKLNVSKPENTYFQLGYAVTKNKSQGKTIKDVFVLNSRNTTLNDEYVKFSRHTHNLHFYTTDRDLASWKHRAKEAQLKAGLSIYDDKEIAYNLVNSDKLQETKKISNIISISGDLKELNDYIKTEKAILSFENKQKEMLSELKVIADKYTQKENQTLAEELLDLLYDTDKPTKEDKLIIDNYNEKNAELKSDIETRLHHKINTFNERFLPKIKSMQHNFQKLNQIDKVKEMEEKRLFVISEIKLACKELNIELPINLRNEDLITTKTIKSDVVPDSVKEAVKKKNESSKNSDNNAVIEEEVKKPVKPKSIKEQYKDAYSTLRAFKSSDEARKLRSKYSTKHTIKDKKELEELEKEMNAYNAKCISLQKEVDKLKEKIKSNDFGDDRHSNAVNKLTDINEKIEVGEFNQSIFGSQIKSKKHLTDVEKDRLIREAEAQEVYDPNKQSKTKTKNGFPVPSNPLDLEKK